MKKSTKEQQQTPADPSRRRVLQTAALGSALLTAAPHLLALSHGHNALTPAWQPIKPTSADEVSAKMLRESLLAGLNLIPVVGGFFSYLGGLFIPNIGLSAEQMWIRYIDGRISDALFRLVSAELEGLTDISRLYTDVVKSGDKAAIGTQSIACNTSLTAAMPTFRLSGEEGKLLPLYSVAATLHLSLLRDMAMSAEEIGFSESYRQTIVSQLKECISKYTRHVDDQVAAVMDRTRSENPNNGTPGTRNQPLAALMNTKAELYKSTIDFRDCWYAMDAETHPGPTQVKLGRELYSLVGRWDANTRPPASIPDYEVVDSPVRSIDFWQQSFANRAYLSGVSVLYQNGNRISTGSQAGKSTTIVFPGGDLRVNQIRVYFNSTLQRVDLGVPDNPMWKSIGEKDTLLDPNIASHEDHTLTSIRSAGRGNNTNGNHDSGYIVGFRLIEASAQSIAPAALRQIEPHLPSRLLDWVINRG